MGASAPRVKVCGVTTVADALLAADLGADLIGLNFYPRSPRHLTQAAAAEIADALRRRAGRAPGVVGVFVAEAPDRIAEIDRVVGLDLLQFHGDESVETLAPYGARALKVLRWSARPPADFFAAFDAVWGFLLDRKTSAGGPWGGSGEAWDYAEAAALPTSKPVLLAGGIGPANVRAALAAARPWGVDVCSRVESAPGVKDPHLLAALFREIRDGAAQSA